MAMEALHFKKIHIQLVQFPSIHLSFLKGTWSLPLGQNILPLEPSWIRRRRWQQKKSIVETGQKRETCPKKRTFPTNLQPQVEVGKGVHRIPWWLMTIMWPCATIGFYRHQHLPPSLSRLGGTNKRPTICHGCSLASWYIQRSHCSCSKKSWKWLEASNSRWLFFGTVNSLVFLTEAVFCVLCVGVGGARSVYYVYYGF